MKKKLVIIVVVLLVVLALLLYFFLNKGESNSTKKLQENDSNIEEVVTITQSEMSSFIFVTQEDETNHILNINLTPFLGFNVQNKDIKRFRISNFSGSNPKSEVILISPTDLDINTPNRTFLFTVQDNIIQEDLKSSIDSIEYEVSTEVSKFNEVNITGDITPNFGIIIKDIGRVNYKEILEKDGTFDGSKYLEYSKTPLELLDTEIQFDVNIKFTDGEEYNKRFKALLKGESFSTESSPLVTLEVVE